MSGEKFEQEKRNELETWVSQQILSFVNQLITPTPKNPNQHTAQFINSNPVIPAPDTNTKNHKPTSASPESIRQITVEEFSDILIDSIITQAKLQALKEFKQNDLSEFGYILEDAQINLLADAIIKHNFKNNPVLQEYAHKLTGYLLDIVNKATQLQKLEHANSSLTSKYHTLLAEFNSQLQQISTSLGKDLLGTVTGQIREKLRQSTRLYLERQTNFWITRLTHESDELLLSLDEYFSSNFDTLTNLDSQHTQEAIMVYADQIMQLVLTHLLSVMISRSYGQHPITANLTMEQLRYNLVEPIYQKLSTLPQIQQARQSIAKHIATHGLHHIADTDFSTRIMLWNEVLNIAITYMTQTESYIKGALRYYLSKLQNNPNNK